jgi:ethanolamine kinase
MFTHYPSQQEKLHFLSAYVAASGGGLQQQEELLAKVDLYMIVSHLLWASWGLYQARTSSIDFDYRSLAVNRLDSSSSLRVSDV